MSVLRRWRQQRARRAGRRVDEREERGRLRQWFLLAGRCDASQLTAPPVASLAPIYPPDDAFWADPFCWPAPGGYVVFFEELPFATGRGHISALPLDGDGRPAGAAVRVLAEDCHLSYPFLFAHGGELYMIPEKGSARRVDVYRCVQFPERWERVRTLIDSAALRDATLFEHEGRWWLFCSMTRGRLRANESLVAFHADSPLSDRWIPHPGNPLVRDFSRGRPAGRILRLADGALLRPSQDCVRRYGHGLNLSEIVTLSPRRYAERLVWKASGEQVGGWHGLHHLDWCDGMLVMDAQRLIPAPGAGG